MKNNTNVRIDLTKMLNCAEFERVTNILAGDVSGLLAITAMYIENGYLCMVYTDCSDYSVEFCTDTRNDKWGKFEFVARVKLTEELYSHIHYWYKEYCGEDLDMCVE